MENLSVGMKRGEAPTVRALRVAGTRPSVRNFQQLTSTGVPSLDAIIGGGIAVGTLVMIEEDVFANFSHVLCRYFLAEGIAWQHSLYVASLDRLPASILQSSPRAVSEANDPVSNSVRSSTSSLSSPDELKIAWQYRHLRSTDQPAFTTLPGGHHHHYFDLSCAVDPSLLEAATCHTFGPKDLLLDDGGFSYDRLLRALMLAASDPAYDATAPTTSTTHPRLLRVLLRSLGPPLWQSDASSQQLCGFLLRLRAMLQRTMSVGLVTVPRRVMQNPTTAFRLRSLCDTVISLESFEGSTKTTNPIFKDYQGLLHVVKLSCLNTLSTHRPLSRDFGFKLRRKKFTIETLHLPPELGETVVRGREEFEFKNVGCGAGRGGNSKLDF